MTIANPKRYRELSEPFADAEKMNKEIDRFYALVAAARVECRIPDALVVIRANYLHEGEEAAGQTILHFGDSLQAESLAVWASGFIAAEREAYHSKIMKQPALMAAKGEAK